MQPNSSVADMQSAPLVFQPTQVPAGLALVENDLLADANDERWLSFTRSPREDAPQLSAWERVNGVSVAFEPDGERLVAVVAADSEWCAMLVAAGLTEQEFRSAVLSIPVVAEQASFAKPVDNPITHTVSGGAVASWLGSDLPVRMMEGSDLIPMADRGHHDDLVVMVGGMGTEGIMLAVLEGEANPLEEVALIVPNPRLISLDRTPIVVGWDPDAQRSHAMWLQRDRFWHLLGKRPLPELLEIAARIQGKVEEVA